MNATLTATTVSAALRDGTRDEHVAMDRHPLMVRAARGLVDRSTWSMMVVQNRSLHAALADAMDIASKEEPRVGRVFAPYHRWLDLFDQDLDALRVMTVHRQPLECTRRATAWIASLAYSEPVALLGVLYVLLGSANIGPMLVRTVSRGLGLSEGPGVQSLNPYGTRTQAVWNAFRESLDELALNEEETEAVVEAAREMHREMMEWMDAVAVMREAGKAA